MEPSAQFKHQRILITNVGTFLGTQLAQKLTGYGLEVLGSGSKKPKTELLESSKFTFLESDLAQPLPAHLPEISTIVHLSQELPANSTVGNNTLSAESEKLINLASPSLRVFFLARISDIEKILSRLETKTIPNLKLIAIGDVYGPRMDLHTTERTQNQSYFENNALINLISQALETDKIILQNEGTETIYPAYIDDVVGELALEVMENRGHAQPKFIVSSVPQAALSLSYEIQNKARTILHKELNIYFAGEKDKEQASSQPQVKIHNPHPHSSHKFADGVEKTFTYFRENGNKKIEIELGEPTPKINVANFHERMDIGKNIEKTQKLKLKFTIKPSFPLGHGKLKRTALVLLIIFFISCARITLNLHKGSGDLKAAKQALIRADYGQAQAKSQNAVKAFSSARKSTGIITAPFSFLNFAKGLNSAVLSLEIGSNALISFTQGAQILSANMAAITSSVPAKTALDLENPVVFFTKAYFDSEHAKTLSKSAIGTPFIKTQIINMEKSFDQLSQLALTAQELTILTPDIVGADLKKTYLVLLMNNAELRPGGGFIGTYAQVSFEDSKLKDINVQDIYEIDGQLKEVIAPPTPLAEKLGVKQLFLRDSNWSGDFRVNAQTARDFYKKETGSTVDGVIALDLTFVENLLAKIGPVRLEDYNEDITSANLLEKGQYYSEVGFFPGSTQKRDFFATLTATLLNKMFESLASADFHTGDVPNTALIETLAEGLSQKHIMLSFDNTNLNALTKSKGWDNPIPPQNYDPKDDTSSTRDFLSLSEANIGANKVNRYLKREIAYDMTVGRDADLMATLTLTYKNESPADTWPAGTYVNYLRILSPANSSLESYSVNGKEVDINREAKGKIIPVVETTQAGNLTQFATTVEVPVKNTKTLTFKYRIPKNIKLETAPTYELYISKQPGTLSDPIKFTFNLPGYLKIDSVNGNEDEKGKQNLTQETNLLVDRHFQIKVSRK